MTEQLPDDLSNLTAHEYADMFPMIAEPERAAFRKSIADDGLAEEIVIYLGKILDGRNRYRELKVLGWETQPHYFITWDELRDAKGLADDPFAYVINKNLHRRHLTDGQRAMAAVEATRKRPGQRNDIHPRGGLDNTEPSANLRQVTPTEAATLFSVSDRTLSSAFRVTETGVPELQELVRNAKVPVSVAEEIARMPAEDQHRAVANHKPDELKNVAKKFGRERRLQSLAQKDVPLPLKRYMVIYADPEWQFLTRSENGMDRSADNHYPTSPVDVLMRRRVGDIAADDCVLFMWATVPMLIEAIMVAHAWGFCLFGIDGDGFLTIDKRKSRYVSNWEWVKTTIGNGYWGRNNHETLLIFTKGNPVAPAPGTQPRSAMHFPEVITKDDTDGICRPVSPLLTDGAGITLQPGEHSAKPWQFRDWIDRLFPNVNKIELNARVASPGWDVWGNEAPELPPENDGRTDAERSLMSDIMGMAAETTAELAAKLPPPVKSTPEEVATRREEKRRKSDKDRQDARTAELETKMRSIGRDLPDDDAGLLAEYRKAIDAMDAAMTAGNAKGVKAARDRQTSIIFKCNDWQQFGCMVNARGCGIRDAAMVRDNPHATKPKFGQLGAFRVSVDDPGIRAIVGFKRYSDDGLTADVDIYATTLDELFTSETGYHSVMGVSCLGMSIADVAIEAVKYSVKYATDKKLNSYAKGLSMPSRAYTIAGDGITVTVNKERKS